jgi:hypothetical protein
MVPIYLTRYLREVVLRFFTRQWYRLGYHMVESSERVHDSATACLVFGLERLAGGSKYCRATPVIPDNTGPITGATAVAALRKPATVSKTKAFGTAATFAPIISGFAQPPDFRCIFQTSEQEFHFSS